MSIIGGADELVGAGMNLLRQLLEGVFERLDVFFGRSLGLFGGAGDLNAVLVGAGDEPNVIAGFWRW